MRNLKKTKVLICGGLSFIGSNFIKNLMKQEKYEILNLDKISYSSVEILRNNIKKKNYFFRKCDISHKSNLSKIILKFQPKIIINFASESHVDRSIDSPDEFIKSNLISVFNLLEIIRINKTILNNPKIVHISTDEVYGSITKGSFNEDSKFNPSSPYSTTKASAELFVKSWSKLYKLNSVILNCVNNFGPFQFPEKLIPLTILKFQRGEKVEIYGDGKNIREWIFVEDFCKSIHKVAFSKNKFDQYCITSGFEINNLDLVKYIYLKINNKKDEENHKFINFVKDRPAHDMRYSLNNKRYSTEFTSKKMTKKEFLKKIDLTIDWYLNNINFISKYKNYDGKRIGIIKK